MKIHKKEIPKIKASTIYIGNCFIWEDNYYMRIKSTGTFDIRGVEALSFEDNGIKVFTRDALVLPINVHLVVE